MTILAESHVEEAALAWLAELGYRRSAGSTSARTARIRKRASYGDVVLVERLRAAIGELNPNLSAETRGEVLTKVLRSETPSLIAENRRLHHFLIEGVPVEVRREDGTIRGDNVRLIDFADPDANDWLAVNQFTVIEDGTNRRPDVVVFVNGLPLARDRAEEPRRRERHPRRRLQPAADLQGADPVAVPHQRRCW